MCVVTFYRLLFLVEIRVANDIEFLFLVAKRSADGRLSGNSENSQTKQQRVLCTRDDDSNRCNLFVPSFKS